jgi:hypothetical protein
VLRAASLALVLLSGCAAPPEPVEQARSYAPPPAPPPTPRDQALGLYGPVADESAAPVETHDGQEPTSDFYDADNPGLAHLQRASEATARFPRDRLGNVDWVRTLADGHVAPRASLDGRGPAGRTLDSAILLTDTRDMRHAVRAFPASRARRLARLRELPPGAVRCRGRGQPDHHDHDPGRRLLWGVPRPRGVLDLRLRALPQRAW